MHEYPRYRVIEFLLAFAAGSTTGGLEGGLTPGYLGGLAKSVVFALRAGACIGRESKA